MSEHRELIEAFRTLDFEMLNKLLDDNKAYMDVPKKVFLESLYCKLTENNVSTYEKLTETTCNSCFKACKVYRLSAKDCPALNLLFIENKGELTDIRICGDSNIDKHDECNDIIYLRFYEEEKVGFSNSLSYLMNLQKIEKAIEEYKQLEELGLVPVQEVVYWYRKMEDLASQLGIDDLFRDEKYKGYNEVSSLVHNYEKLDLAKKSLKKYKSIDHNDERSVVQWLLENKHIRFFSLKKTDNWKKTGILILQTKPNLVVDCSGFLEPYLFKDIYDNHQKEIMESINLQKNITNRVVEA